MPDSYIMWKQATTQIQSTCDDCDARRNFVCTYHSGWADGYDAALVAVLGTPTPTPAPSSSGTTSA